MEYVKLGDIAKIVAGSTAPKENQFNDNIGLPFIRAGHLEDLCNNYDLRKLPKIDENNKNIKKQVKVPKNTIVFAKSGMSCMKSRVYQTTEECYIVNHLAGVICSENVNPSYLKYYFMVNKPNRLIVDESYPSIRLSDISNMDIYLPNLDTQQKIAEVLDKAQELIYKRKEQIDALDELVKSRFIEMFGDTFLNTKGFEMKKIKDITQIVKGVTYKPEQVSDKGTIVLRSSNIQNSKFDLKDIVRINKKIDEKFLVKQNDILMCNRNGSERLVGKVAKIPMSNEDMTFGTFMTIIRSPYFNYLFSFFQTEGFRRQIKMQTSVAINQISIPLLESVNVPLPPMELQNEFADFVNQVDKLKSQMETSLKELEDNFNSLMQKAFKGELF